MIRPYVFFLDHPVGKFCHRFSERNRLHLPRCDVYLYGARIHYSLSPRIRPRFVMHLLLLRELVLACRNGTWWGQSYRSCFYLSHSLSFILDIFFFTLPVFKFTSLAQRVIFHYFQPSLLDGHEIEVGSL